MTIMLNIGLANTGHLSQKAAVSTALALLGSHAGPSKVVQSDTEPTLVVETYGDPSPTTVYRVAVALDQDCVAYYSVGDDLGLLIGPRPDSWAPFDKTLFRDLDGRPLAGLRYA